MRQAEKLTLDDGQRTPLRFLPARAQKPLLYFSDQLCKVLGIRLHDLVELGKLSWPKEDFSHSKLELVFTETKCFKQSLKTINDTSDSVVLANTVCTLQIFNDDF